MGFTGAFITNRPFIVYENAAYTISLICKSGQYGRLPLWQVCSTFNKVLWRGKYQQGVLFPSNFSYSRMYIFQPVWIHFQFSVLVYHYSKTCWTDVNRSVHPCKNLKYENSYKRKDCHKRKRNLRVMWKKYLRREKVLHKSCEKMHCDKYEIFGVTILHV